MKMFGLDALGGKPGSGGLADSAKQIADAFTQIGAALEKSVQLLEHIDERLARLERLEEDHAHGGVHIPKTSPVEALPEEIRA